MLLMVKQWQKHVIPVVGREVDKKSQLHSISEPSLGYLKPSPTHKKNAVNSPEGGVADSWVSELRRWQKEDWCECEASLGQ